MAIDARVSADSGVDRDETHVPTKEWYDRSSLPGDFMVMIAGQTEEDYFRRCPESKFCEFIDGTVYMPSPVTVWHQFEVQFLAALLQLFIQHHRSGILLTGPAALKLRPDCVVEPDVFILPPGGESQMHGVYCDLPAHLVVEVLSRSNRSHDLKKKAANYRAGGVAEIWFVDDRDRCLIAHRRGKKGYKTVKVQSGPYRSLALPGFWLDVSWLWSDPRPSILECFEAILAGPPV